MPPVYTNRRPGHTVRLGKTGAGPAGARRAGRTGLDPRARLL